MKRDLASMLSSATVPSQGMPMSMDLFPAARDNGPVAGEATMQPYEPTVRDNIGHWIAGDGSNPWRQDMARRLVGSAGAGTTDDVSAIGLTPIGSMMDGQDAYRRGDKTGMALAALGSIPGVNVESKIASELADAAGKTAAKKVGKVAARNKTKTAIGGVFDNVNDYGQAMRMADRGEHLKQTPNGAYVGAPEGIDSPGALGAMRKRVDAKVDDGMFNATWYDRARDTASDVSGFNPATMGHDTSSPQGAMASLFSRGGAAYSPQAAPMSEINYFLNQHNNKVLTGQDFRAKTGSQMNNVAKAYAPDPTTGGFIIEPENIKLGKKTGPYADAKNPTIEDKALYKTANDIWHGRVFGYQNADGSKFDRAFTPQEHGFLTGENLLAAERANARLRIGHNGGPALDDAAAIPELTPRSMQAATWGSERRAQRVAEEQAKMNAAHEHGARAY